MGQLTYLGLLAGCLVVTAPLELVLRVRVYARWRRLLLAVVPEFVVFVVWVLYAIAQGHWDYSRTRTLDVRLPGGIPVEEVLFFLVVPLCSVLALEAVRKVTGWDAGYPTADDSRGSTAARHEPGADRGVGDPGPPDRAPVVDDHVQAGEHAVHQQLEGHDDGVGGPEDLPGHHPGAVHGQVDHEDSDDGGDRQRGVAHASASSAG